MVQGLRQAQNGCYMALKAVWLHPADVVCCDSNEPLRAAQPQSKAVARQMVRSKAKLAKHGLTRATVCAGTDRRLQTVHDKAVEAKMSLGLHIKTLGRKLTFLSTYLTRSSRTYIDFINQSLACKSALCYLITLPITLEWLPPGHPEDPFCYVQPGVHSLLHLAVSSFHRVSKVHLSPFIASIIFEAFKACLLAHTVKHVSWIFTSLFRGRNNLVHTYWTWTRLYVWKMSYFFVL